MPVENAEVARLFRETADLLEIRGDNAFRVRAYRNAARVLEQHPDSVADLAADGPRRLTELPGIGRDLAGKIREVVERGTFPLLEELRREDTAGAATLTRVPGVGPKRARALYDALGIRTLDDLERAARQERIRTLPGFGEKTERAILRELAGRSTGGERVRRARAVPYAEAIVEHIRSVPGVAAVEVAGSYRRARETVGDVDILVTCRGECAVVDRFTAHPEVADVLARGAKRASVQLRSGLQVDLRILAEDSYGAGLHYFTGSQAHNIAVRRIAQGRGLKLNEYGVYRGDRKVAGRTEEDVFRAVGLPWIPPELREDRGEIEAARSGRLPRLVRMDDIRGDLQVHTRDSDGRASLEEMVDAAEARGYEYVAITDHSPAVRIARGPDARGFRDQMRRIDRLNRRRGITVLKGAEVDIRADGTLDLGDDLLEMLDVVLIALHSRLDLPQERQTARVLRALRHPAVDILAHPTGRRIGHRRGADLEIDRVIDAAVDRGVMLEINAQPDRLDIDDALCRRAIDRGARLVVSTDAHAPADLDHMRWGIDQARRGWAERRHIANTRPLNELRDLLHDRR